MSSAFQKIVAQNLKAPEDRKAEIEKEKEKALTDFERRQAAILEEKKKQGVSAPISQLYQQLPTKETPVPVEDTQESSFASESLSTDSLTTIPLYLEDIRESVLRIQDRVYMIAPKTEYIPIAPAVENKVKDGEPVSRKFGYPRTISDILRDISDSLKSISTAPSRQELLRQDENSFFKGPPLQPSQPAPFQNRNFQQFQPRPPFPGRGFAAQGQFAAQPRRTFAPAGESNPLDSNPVTTPEPVSSAAPQVNNPDSPKATENAAEDDIDEEKKGGDFEDDFSDDEYTMSGGNYTSVTNPTGNVSVNEYDSVTQPLVTESVTNNSVTQPPVTNNSVTNDSMMNDSVTNPNTAMTSDSKDDYYKVINITQNPSAETHSSM